MKKRNFIPLWSALAITLSLLTIGCEEGTSTPGVSVDDVDQVELTRAVSVTDFSSGGGVSTDITALTDKDDLVSDLSAIFETISMEFDENSDFEDFDPDEAGSGVTYTSDPTNLFDLPEMPDDFSIFLTALNVSPSTGWLINGSVDLDLDMPMDSNDNPERITASVALAGADLDVPLVDATTYRLYGEECADIKAARILAEANAELDVILDWEYDAEYDFSMPVDIEAAYSISLDTQIAVSYDNTANGGHSGNLIISIEYFESQELHVTESMMNDGTAGDYLDNQLVPAEFTVTIAAYPVESSTPINTWTYSIDELTDLGMEFL